LLVAIVLMPKRSILSRRFVPPSSRAVWMSPRATRMSTVSIWTAGAGPAGGIGGYADRAEGDGKDDDTRGSHTLHFPRLRFGPHRADGWISPAKRQSMVNEAYLI